MVEPKYIEFFLNSDSSIVELECLELIHPNFSAVHRVVRNAVHGVTVTHEDGFNYEYVYYPLSIRRQGSLEDLDFGLQIELGDLGGLLQKEVDGIAASGGFQTKPTCNIRRYRSDDLSAPMHDAQRLTIEELAFNVDGAQFDAIAPFKNVSSTGELYDLNRFPQMRGFL